MDDSYVSYTARISHTILMLAFLESHWWFILVSASIIWWLVGDTVLTLLAWMIFPLNDERRAQLRAQLLSEDDEDDEEEEEEEEEELDSDWDGAILNLWRHCQKKFPTKRASFGIQGYGSLRMASIQFKTNADALAAKNYLDTAGVLPSGVMIQYRMRRGRLYDRSIWLVWNF